MNLGETANCMGTTFGIGILGYGAGLATGTVLGALRWDAATIDRALMGHVLGIHAAAICILGNLARYFAEAESTIGKLDAMIIAATSIISIVAQRHLQLIGNLGTVIYSAVALSVCVFKYIEAKELEAREKEPKFNPEC